MLLKEANAQFGSRGLAPAATAAVDMFHVYGTYRCYVVVLLHRLFHARVVFNLSFTATVLSFLYAAALLERPPVSGLQIR